MVFFYNKEIYKFINPEGFLCPVLYSDIPFTGRDYILFQEMCMWLFWLTLLKGSTMLGIANSSMSIDVNIANNLQDKNPIYT